MNIKILKKQFLQYIIPSMFAMLLSSFYAIVDGLFVGNAAGNAALGAINLVWPLQCVINATAIGVGIGSAVLMSTHMGNNNKEEAQKACSTGIALLIILGIVLPLMILLFLPQLLSFLGATGDLAGLCKQYIVVILIGGIFPMIGNGCNPLIRNKGNTISATILMCTGLFTNIILDYYLVFSLKLGLFGAGLATIIAQAVVACTSFWYLLYTQRELFHKKMFSFDLKDIKKIIRIGISPFGQALVPSLVIIFTNWKCITYGGNDAVTIFSVVTYILSTVQLMLQGIGDGVQPLFSFYYGANKRDELRWMYRHAFALSLAVSITFTVIVAGFAGYLSDLFAIDLSLKFACVRAIRISTLAFTSLGIARLICAYFYATGQPKESTLLVYIEPCVLLPMSLIIMSRMYQMDGVWFSYPLVQMILCIMALWISYLVRIEQKQFAIE